VTAVALAASDEDSQAPDVILAWLVSVFDDMIDRDRDRESVLGLTLAASGLVIVGNLIPAWRWFEEIDRIYARAFAWGLPARSYRQGAEARVKAREVPESENEMRRPAYIHLADARVMTPQGPTPATEGAGYWRCRLSEITGWMPGALVVADTKPGTTPVTLLAATRFV
jgi:hypothetical protein